MYVCILADIVYIIIIIIIIGLVIMKKKYGIWNME